MTDATPSWADSLLETKFSPPPLKPGLVERPRLHERLSTDLVADQGFARKLTLIAGPAGYGKTTLAAQWLPTLNTRTAWLTLEPEDDDPIRFLRYLLGALQRAAVGLGSEAQAMLAAPQAPAQEVVLTSLINELAARPDRLLLALDDYHVIQSLPIHQALSFLVEHLPGSLHLLIASREDPPLPLPRLEARGEALLIRERDLAFQEQEAGEFFRQKLGPVLDPRETAALTRRTEGWVTGLQLAALSMQDVSDRAAFVRSFTGSSRFVLDYLFEEVFNHQPESIQAFLLQTAVLDRFCAELCDAVTDASSSVAVIQRLERGHFFIVPLEQTGRWYRYHRLFGDLLRHRLRTDGEWDVADLHLRACQWYEAEGHPSDAIKHALAGAHWERAARLITAASDSVLRNGEVKTLLSWCHQLPESVRGERPGLNLAHAWALLLTGELEQASKLLEQARRMAQDSDQLLGEIASAEAFIARTLGDLPRTIELSREALELLPEEDRTSRGNLSVNLGIITWHQGQLEETERLLSEGLAHALATQNHYAAHTAQVFQARTLASRGKLLDAERRYREALRAGDQVPTAVIAHIDMAALMFERNAVADAEEHLERATQLAADLRNVEFQVACQIEAALIRLELGGLRSAEQALHRAGELASDRELPVLTRARKLACQAQLAIAQGNLADARRLLEDMPVEHDAHTFYRFLELNHARLDLAEGRVDRARERLVQAAVQAKQSGWGYGLLTIQVLEALAAESRESAVETLAGALRRAEPEGYIRLFLIQGGALVPLLKEAVRSGTAPGYVGRILAAQEAAPTVSPGQAGELIEPLTERELEVLNLVVAGLSNREIAKLLTISLGTAKTHVHNLYGKLGVGSRVQAVSRARELNLI